MSDSGTGQGFTKDRWEGGEGVLVTQGIELRCVSPSSSQKRDGKERTGIDHKAKRTEANSQRASVASK